MVGQLKPLWSTEVIKSLGSQKNAKKLSTSCRVLGWIVIANVEAKPGAPEWCEPEYFSN
jgi:hypothetical protein